jgi:hypothetical protein
MKKVYSEHSLTLLLTGISLLVWCFLFRFFVNGQAPLQGDAYAYMGHMRFYLESMAQGVYPLWNPHDNYGNMNDFYLRRIGEFNPFFWAIIVLNKCGLSFVLSYRLFLVMYFFLGVAGFYALARRLLNDHLAAFSAALVLLFSCIGAGIFESYIVLEIVPFIWFFFFLVSFIQEPEEFALLGAVFCLMIINITYIPFYFYTIFLVLGVCVGVFNPAVSYVYPEIKRFIISRKIFLCLCALLLAASFVPGILWYHQAGRGEDLTMQRHTGSHNINSATVGLNKVNEGGIVPDFIFDRQFANLDKVGLHEFYLSLFVYLMLFAGMWERLNRRLIILFVFGFTVFLIGLADASYVHRFLYSHVPFFKYFRNVQFFLQFAILPAVVLFAVEQMRIFMRERDWSLGERRWMSLWVVIVHSLVFVLFLIEHAGWFTFAAIILNLGWMLARIWSKGGWVVWVLLLWGAIIFQPFEVYSPIAINYPPQDQWSYNIDYDLNLPSIAVAKEMVHKKFQKIDAGLPYFATHWFYEAISALDYAVFSNYLNAPFILYTQIQPVAGQMDYHPVQDSMVGFKNMAYVSGSPIKTFGDDNSSALGDNSAASARIITYADQDFKVLKADANEVAVHTAFARPYFLVRNQNYHSLWKAFIDGKPAELLRTNICLQGLWVPAGEHVVRWSFGGPVRYFWNYFLVLLYPLVLIGLLWLWSRSRISVQK